MKNLLLFAVVAIFATSCDHLPNKDAAKTSERKDAATLTSDGIIYLPDTASTVTWNCSKVDGIHSGYFKLGSANFTVKDSAIKSGSFVIDVKSIHCTDLVGEEKAKIEKHLLSADFFDVEKFGTAEFEITEVKPFAYDASKDKDVVMKDATHLISGNLTLKSIVKNVSFPAKVKFEMNTFSVLADFNIDRTDWGLNYKGPNNPSDWFISKTVNLKLNISGKSN